MVALAVLLLGCQLGGRAALPNRLAPIRCGIPKKIVELTADNWCEHVEGVETLAVVSFYAPWCRTCKAVAPAYERLAYSRGHEATFFRVNFREQEKLCYDQRIFKLPSVYLYAPNIGCISRSMSLTPGTISPVLRRELDRFLLPPYRLKRLQEALNGEQVVNALSPLVRYKDLVGVLEGLARAQDFLVDPEEFLINQKKPKAALREAMLDERRLRDLEVPPRRPSRLHPSPCSCARQNID